MQKFAGATKTVFIAALLILGTAAISRAGEYVPVPEVDPTNGMAAMALVAGAVLMIRSRIKK